MALVASSATPPPSPFTVTVVPPIPIAYSPPGIVKLEFTRSSVTVTPSSSTPAPDSTTGVVCVAIKLPV